MQSANHGKNNRMKKRSSLVWLTTALLTVLVVATVSVVGSCLYNYVHQSDCQISLYDGEIKKSVGTLRNAASQKKETSSAVTRSQARRYSGSEAKAQSERSAFKVEDATQVWKTATSIELFQSDYQNADGTVTVRSADGSKVIAPGTEGNYTFSLKNTSDTSADYKIWVEAKLSTNLSGVPVQTRMSGADGWLLGGKNSWKRADELNGVTTTETIGAGKTAEYTIYWQWPFDQGKDEDDTSVGNVSTDQEMTYTVTIYTLTAAATTTDDGDMHKAQSQNAAERIRRAVKTGDDTQILLWLITLAAATGVLICLIAAKKRKNDNKE